MTLSEISQLFIIGLPEDNDLSVVRELAPGGVVLMGRNAGTPNETRRLTRAIREACAESGAVAPFIATDHEGGRVQRLHDGFTVFPPAREIGAHGAQSASLAGMTAAAELRDAGVNFNFAPVCDVPTHEGDTVIGNRAWSDDFIKASLLVAEYVRGAGTTVLSCAKHFPGHGGVGVDSHQGLPVFEGTRAELSPHLGPFRAAIAAGVGAVMTGHIAVPALDESGAPASLSANITTKLLREELNFRCLVVTDDLEMGALKDLDAGEVAVRALQAGNDVLLWCHAPDKVRAAQKAIAAALESGELAEERVRDALARVAWAKKKYGIVVEKKAK
ncbi:MAG TPA: glycoside hydrolase family 3 N-terminal domain-containing protein [Abditibacteriaceae bacterium]|jgi:beta-N-acetylhexosaminidase